MLKTLKAFPLRTAPGPGVSKLLLDIGWPSQPLLILCNHSNPYVDPRLLRRRSELLPEHGCRVQLLGEAIGRLSAGELPFCCVAIAVDDGASKPGVPRLHEFDYPAAMCGTTHDSELNRPPSSSRPPASSESLVKQGGNSRRSSIQPSAWKWRAARTSS